MTPDVNVLLAASRTDHPHHRPALAWLQQALSACDRGQRFSLLPMVAAAFLRLATHPKVFLAPTPLAQAHDFLTAIGDTPGVVLVPLGEEWPLFEHLCQQHSLAGNAIADAWIAAAVLANHEHLVSFDQGFRQLLRPHQLTLLRP